jgi:hypothetical protein
MRNGVSSLLDILFKKSYWSSSWSTKDGVPTFVFESEEVQRVLAMGLPAAVVVKLPRFGSLSCGGMETTTDILLYFPEAGRVVVYEQTANEPLRKVGNDIKFFGKFQDNFDVEPFPELKRYDYTVELAAFGNRPPTHKVCRVSYLIHFEPMCGVAWVRLDCDHDDDYRDNEKFSVSVAFGGNEGTVETKPVATWLPEPDEEEW